MRGENLGQGLTTPDREERGAEEELSERERELRDLLEEQRLEGGVSMTRADISRLGLGYRDALTEFITARAGSQAERHENEPRNP